MSHKLVERVSAVGDHIAPCGFAHQAPQRKFRSLQVFPQLIHAILLRFFDPSEDRPEGTVDNAERAYISPLSLVYVLKSAE